MPNPRVLLIHGLILSPLSMAPLGARLERQGWSTSYFAYSSLFEPTLAAQARLGEVLATRPTHIVAHSLGGLLALGTLCAHPRLPVERVVCLGTPLRGSGAATGLHRWPGAAWGVGRSDALLRTGVPCWPDHLAVGMLAGDVRMGLGANFAGFKTDHDGTVSIDETQVSGLADHLVVPASHTSMLFSAPVAAQVDYFLRHGRFDQSGRK